MTPDCKHFGALLVYEKELRLKIRKTAFQKRRRPNCSAAKLVEDVKQKTILKILIDNTPLLSDIEGVLMLFATADNVAYAAAKNSISSPFLTFLKISVRQV